MTEATKELMDVMKTQAEKVLDTRKHMIDRSTRSYYRGMLKTIVTIEGSERHADERTDS